MPPTGVPHPFAFIRGHLLRATHGPGGAPRQRSPGIPRGRVATCNGCGYVFVVKAVASATCRRCGDEDLTPYRLTAA